ncbi:MAG: PRC and DUF2382 domain-containing protein [Intrasporangium sp.]|uniref:PRC-barrel domain-containing protein n=1 Tax=Intrasporangium sp. TaxID=1925024 RepID=UPI00264827F9|nr:PRC-barrel domain-containing protein [Intrasporangium sp.]MDN5798211.1 PRC and DUF2382 domain-containing protein [Intrasporangium sp.]
MISTNQIQDLLEGGGGTVVGQDGAKIGKVGKVDLDDRTGEPEWVTTKTGMFGGAESFVPLSQGSLNGTEIQVPYDKDTVKDPPRLDDSEGHLTQDQEKELYRYYGLDYSKKASDSGLPNGGAPRPDGQPRERRDRAGEQGTVGRDVSGPTTNEAMTRSEEQLDVGPEKVPSGTARPRKYVVTEAECRPSRRR